MKTCEKNKECPFLYFNFFRFYHFEAGSYKRRCWFYRMCSLGKQLIFSCLIFICRTFFSPCVLSGCRGIAPIIIRFPCCGFRIFLIPCRGIFICGVYSICLNPLANGSGIGKAELLKFSIHEKQTNVAIIRLGDVPDELTSVGCRREQALV